MSTHESIPRTSGRKTAVDWNDVRQRLDATRIAVERVWTAEPEEAKRILRARAQTLAREPGNTEAADALELVEFVLAHENYGVETCFVREIHPLTDLTPLPCAPGFVLGVVNLRGEIVSVIDIKKFFDLPEKGLTDLNRLIVLRSETMLFGILADTVIGVRRIPIADIQPSLPTLSGIREQYLKGVSSGRTVVLDAEKLLGDERIVVQEQVER